MREDFILKRNMMIYKIIQNYDYYWIIDIRVYYNILRFRISIFLNKSKDKFLGFDDLIFVVF